MRHNNFVAILFALVFLAAAVARAQDPAPQPQSPSAPATRNRGGQGSEGERGRPGLFGTITAIHDGAIEISRPDGNTSTAKISATTQYRKDRQEAKLADFKVGDMVFVRGTENPDHTWAADMIGARGAGGPRGPAGPRGQMGPMGTMGTDFVIGEVKALDPPRITVQRPDNVTQTIELSEETSLRKGKESVTMADIQPGDHIFARGGVQDGSFVPKTVMVISPEQWKRMQEMGMGGPPKSTVQAPPAQPAPDSSLPQPPQP